RPPAANQPPPAAALESLRNLADTPPAAPAGPNEVERLVRAVAHREAAVRAAAPPPPPKPSRVLKRLRHFALYAGAGDALLAALALHYGRFDDGISLQIWMAWGLIFTFAVAILVFFFDSAG
ncbi:MAG TPA: hypothetical protein VHE13_00630, partial [Opitutus sp.]|nr:hypothetical protein [Opitutus sp.]